MKRRNQEERSGWKIALGVGTAVLVGGTVGYLVARSRFGEKVFEQIEGGAIRVPDPSFAMEVPSTEEQFAILDALICKCGTPVIKDAKDDTEVQAMVDAITECVLKELYPQFPWPTIPGDHPSVAQLQGAVAVLSLRALITSEICPPDTAQLQGDVA